MAKHDTKDGYELITPQGGGKGVVALMAHGWALEGEEKFAPVSGIQLTYYCAEKSPLDANVTYAESDGSYTPGGEKWDNYHLHTESYINAADFDEWVDNTGIAVAFVTRPMGSEIMSSEILPQLSSAGYTTIRAVHCRE